MLKHLNARTILKTRSWLAVAAVAISLLAGLYFSRGVSAFNNVTWDGGGADNNWSTAANWSGDTVPTSSDVAIFDGTSTKNVTIDVNINVLGIQINTGYTGTVTQASGAAITIGGSAFSQAAGTFNGSSNTITINSNGFGAFTQTGGTFNGGSGDIHLTGDGNADHDFRLSGGTFTSTSGTLFVSRSFRNSGGTFVHNSGTVTFDSIQSPSLPLFQALAGEIFNNLNFSKDNGADVSFSGNVIVLGALALNDGSLSGGGTVEARAGVTVASTFDGGNVTLAIANGGGVTRIFTFAAGANLPNVVLNDPDATINTPGSGVLNWRQLILQQGIVNQGGVDFNFFPPSGGGEPFIQSGGTFNGSSNTITFNSNGFGAFTQSGGAFNGGSGDIHLTGDVSANHDFRLSGGTFTSTSGTLFVPRSFRHNSGGTFLHNSGTVTFASIQSASTPVIQVSAAGDTFNNLNFSKDDGTSISFSGKVIVLGALALNDGSLSGAGGETLQPQGSMTIASTFDGGNVAVTFAGSVNQIFTNNGGANPIGTWTINKSAGKVTLASNLILNSNQALNITSGTLDQGASFNLQTSALLTVGASGTLRDFGTGDLTLGGDLTNNGGTVNINGGGTGCSDPNVSDALQIRSTDMTQRTWSGNGTFALVDVDVDRQTAGTPDPGTITAFGSSNLTNTTGWTNPGGCPVTVASPGNQTACPGGSTSFSVAATGNGLDFQWRKDGVNLSGANINISSGPTSSTLTINPVGPSDAASSPGYDAIATNSFGITATSSAATLSVLTSAAVSANPGSTTVCDGALASFTAAATGNPVPTVQWQVSTDGINFNDIGSATSTTLSFTASAGQNGNKYRAVFSNSCNSAPTTAATLTVNTAPSVSTNPGGTTVCEGALASFTAAANGNPNPTVQWQVSTDGGTIFNDIAGATSTTLSFTTNASQNGNQYRAAFTNSCNTANTAPATLTVNTAPSITTSPGSTSVCEGALASFTAAANGNPSPTVQWQVSTDGGTIFNDIAGATSTTLSFTTSASQNGNQYRSVFTNSCSTVNTSVATLTVDGFSLSSTSQSFTSSGGSGSVDVITAASCSWTAVSNDSFIHITSSSGGTGNGKVTFSVDAGGPPTGTMTIAGQTFTVNESTPTATAGTIEGRIVDDTGQPVSGVVIQLSGMQNRKTITDVNGAYHFANVETTGFYVARPVRANYSFSPADRSFSQLGQSTEATFTAIFTGEATNPLDTPEYFVRQQYVDVLGREPDEVGFNFWSDRILVCGNDVDCIRSQRTAVAAEFFIHQEFQQSGAFIYNLYSGSLSRRPAYAEYAIDRQQVVGGPDLEAEKQAFAESFVQRGEFMQKYQASSTAEGFVDALLTNLRQTTGVDLGSQQDSLRDNLIAHYNTGTNQTESRSFVLRDVTENAAARDANYNQAFVLTEYFGYLRRGPDRGGYDFWLNVLNNSGPGNYQRMVCSFITSTEYQQRFSQLVSHGNSECGQ